MPDGGALISLGELSKPATVLIEKVSEAVGGIAKPWQIKRTARAEADAEIIRVEARIQISEIERRALERMVREEGQRQENIENITARALPHLKPAANPDGVEKDWITNFFEKRRLVSDDEMQSMWASILAGEANAPGSFSKKTIELAASLEKRDAQLFTRFCTFCWTIEEVSPLIFGNTEKIYNDAGINFSSLSHLDSIGLITFNSLSIFIRKELPKYATVFYYGKPVTIEFPSDKNVLKVGEALLTRSGKELASIAGATQSDEYFQYVLKKWLAEGYILSSPVITRTA